MSDEALGITLRGDAELALTYVPEARRLVYRLRESMKWGSRVQGAHKRLSDRAYVYAYAMPGMTRCVIVADYGEQGMELRPIEATTTPDFVSGIVVGGRIVGEVPVLDRFRPTAAAAALHRIPERYSLSARFAVRPHADLPQLDNPDADPPLSQYVKAKSTMWTGAMRIAVQAISAFGKTLAPSVYDGVPPAVLDQGNPNAQPTAHEQRVAQQGLQIRYGYRIERTHGITFGADGKPWLVEISITRGVLAMPLPMFGHTRLSRFRERAERLNDAAGLDLLDRFGGFPSGEVFPSSTEALSAAISGGFVLQLQTASSLSGFYNHSTYSPNQGWAFSDTGHDAVTSVWRYGADNVQRASWWGIALSIGTQTPLDPASGSVRNLQTALLQFDASEEVAWHVRKLERITQSQLQVIARVAQESKARAIEMLAAMVLPPMAAGSATITKRGEGVLWAGWTAKRFPPIAFYNETLGFCVTHDPRPLSPALRPPGVIDTVMWVCYIGNRIAWVRAFDDARELAYRLEDGTEACMYIGQWVTTTEFNPQAPRGFFYTSELDHRRETATLKIVTTRQSSDMGYTSAVVRDDLVRLQWGQLLRTRAFRVTTTTEITGGEILRASVTLPGLDRCAYYYATATTTQIITVARNKHTETLTDPNSYVTWRNVPGYTGSFSGGIYIRDEHPAGCGRVDARTVESAIYESYPCAEFADGGSWADVCQNADSATFAFNLPPMTSATQQTLGKATLEVTLVNALGSLVVQRQQVQSPQIIDETWFLTSPDPETEQKNWCRAMHNCWGDAIAQMYVKTPSSQTAAYVHGQPSHAEMVDAVMHGETYTLLGRVD